MVRVSLNAAVCHIRTKYFLGISQVAATTGRSRGVVSARANHAFRGTHPGSLATRVSSSRDDETLASPRA